MRKARDKHAIFLGAYLLLWLAASGFLIQGLRGPEPTSAAATLPFCIAMIATIAAIIRENRRFSSGTVQSSGADLDLTLLPAAHH